MIETVLDPPPQKKSKNQNKKTIWLQQVQMGTLLVHPL